MDEQRYRQAVIEQAESFTKYFNILFSIKPENNYFLLSGGLDSRLLLTSTEEKFRKKIKGITFDYTTTGGNIVNAKKVADHLGVGHITRIINAEETIEDTLKHLWWCEGVSTHIASRLITFLSEVETDSNLFVDGYLGDTQLGGEFLTCIKDKNLKLDTARSLLRAMQLHNYFFPANDFEKLVKETDILDRVIIPELKKHVEMVWQVDNERMKIETLLALTRGRKYTLGGPKTVEIFGTTVLPFYHPQIFSKFIIVPYELREKRNYELDILEELDKEIAILKTTSSKFKRLKVVQNSLKAVRWFEKKIGLSIIPKSSSPVFMWTEKESAYYKFINSFLNDENSFIWNLFDKEATRKIFRNLFERKNHLELFLASLIDLEIIMRLYFSIDKPEKIILHSDNLNLHLESKLTIDVYDLQKEIYS
jgi:asparagine synthetase B (glutamine-hydrolysing)